MMIKSFYLSSLWVMGFIQVFLIRSRQKITICMDTHHTGLKYSLRCLKNNLNLRIKTEPVTFEADTVQYVIIKILFMHTIAVTG